MASGESRHGGDERPALTDQDVRSTTSRDLHDKAVERRPAPARRRLSVNSTAGRPADDPSGVSSSSSTPAFQPLPPWAMTRAAHIPRAGLSLLSPFAPRPTSSRSSWSSTHPGSPGWGWFAVMSAMSCCSFLNGAWQPFTRRFPWEGEELSLSAMSAYEIGDRSGDVLGVSSSSSTPTAG